MLESIATISGSQDKLKKVHNVETQAEKIQNTKKPPINFFKCNIPVGAELVYKEDPSVKAIVVDEHKVLYNDELTSLSAIARSFKGYPMSGPSYFTYNGKLVSDIARETQWKDL